jgi:hypothetical protein
MSQGNKSINIFHVTNLIVFCVWICYITHRCCVGSNYLYPPPQKKILTPILTLLTSFVKICLSLPSRVRSAYLTSIYYWTWNFRVSLGVGDFELERVGWRRKVGRRIDKRGWWIRWRGIEFVEYIWPLGGLVKGHQGRAPAPWLWSQEKEGVCQN